jgi:hypothetical protein
LAAEPGFILSFCPDAMPVDMFYLFAIYLMLDKTFTSE